jgi:carbamoyl-phosphate synthase small subunit
MTNPIKEALLVLADGTTFEGEAIGADPPNGVATGEAVFNTVMSGYQEVITDPSYAGQVIAFTYPHIGNYGATPDDDESRKPFCRGVVVRDLARRPSNWRSNDDLQSFLASHGVPGIAGVDTRRLTRHIREAGSMPCAFGTADERTLKQAANDERGTDHVDLVATVTTDKTYRCGAAAERPLERGDRPLHVVAYDFGIKRAILRHLEGIATIDVVPASTPAADVLAMQPDGVFLSNGPGDPAAVPYAVDSIKQLVGEIPLFGICLGHQLLALALGAETYKLKFGHHGGNHPVRRTTDNAVEITSQNHNYAVVEGSFPNAVVSHVNLNDGVIEGLNHEKERAFSVQYHPEAGPGPHDARYLFTWFQEAMERS